MHTPPIKGQSSDYSGAVQWSFW